jgi:hypothetical protein
MLKPFPKAKPLVPNFVKVGGASSMLILQEVEKGCGPKFIFNLALLIAC